MSAADEIEQTPTLEELRIQIQMLKEEIRELTPPGLGKVADNIRERPAILALSALGIGLIFGCLLMRSVPGYYGSSSNIVRRLRLARG